MSEELKQVQKSGLKPGHKTTEILIPVGVFLIASLMTWFGKVDASQWQSIAMIVVGAAGGSRTILKAVEMFKK